MERLLFGLLIISISVLLVNNIGLCVGCTDTDTSGSPIGKDYYEKGTCTDDSGSHEDHCNGIYLYEFYCGGDNTCWMESPILCPGPEVCYEGKCSEDLDTDNMADEWEVEHGLDPTVPDGVGDMDGDLLTNDEEFLRGTDPDNPDTDGDGHSDEAEIVLGTDPTDPNDFPKTCSRSGNDIYTKEYCTDYLGEEHWDVCAGRDYVTEYSCSAEKECVASFSADCNAGSQGSGFVCVDGACVKKTCSASLMPPEKCTDNFGTYPPTCGSSSARNEWKCVNKECQKSIKTCSSTEKCVHGICFMNDVVCSSTDDKRCRISDYTDSSGNPVHEEYLDTCNKTDCDSVSLYCLWSSEKCDYECDSEVKICKPDPSKIICTRNEKRCTGNNLEKCSLDETKWEKIETCEYGCENKACKAKPSEKNCTAGEKRCAGNNLEKCKTDGSAWEKIETCEYGCENKACKAKPSTPICTPDSKTCSGNDLQICGKDGFSWTTVETCEHGCDSAKLECKPELGEEPPHGKVCVSGNKRCEGNELQRCREDGMGWEKEKECDYGCENKDCKTKPGCVEDWKCSDWTACAEGKQTRVCVDKNDCGTFIDKPVEEQDCEVPVKGLPVEIIAGIIIVLGGSGFVLFLKGKKEIKEVKKEKEKKLEIKKRK